ncbi:hypothetical protein PLICRDRAFT_178300 [Plicaturopsis crispa FD-325 SS-3]|nr:hypothetical protein PLICRDRAFT_178300 [Plicaturopsis crispa FD-325 SS-3]
MAPLSKPHLPSDFVQKIIGDPKLNVGYESHIYEETTHRRRLAMVSTVPGDSIAPDSSVHATLPGERPSPILTMAHLAASHADPLLLCEMIRLGVTTDLPNVDGDTPLCIALAKLIECATPSPTATREPAPHREARVRRLQLVARILIEQHANINIVKHGFTHLHLACASASWDIIVLLIAHGIDTAPRAPAPPHQHISSPADLFKSARDKRRFHALVAASRTRARTRPPRLCPCFSGKTLAECHAARGRPPQGYPPEFICKCGSAKTYAQCCRRRDIVYVEEWDAEEQWIQCVLQKSLPVPGFLSKAPGGFDDAAKARMMRVLPFLNTQGVAGGPPDPVYDEMMKWCQTVAAIDMCANGMADPAYAYALQLVDFIPRPQGRGTSKFLCAQWQDKWNAAVDEYIVSGVDSRPREDIERCAKIGISGGALFRLCEGTGCHAVEGPSTTPFAVCAKCKITVYCGKECQRSAWTEHKKHCGHLDQREQALPSQVAFDEYMLPRLFAHMNSIPTS